MYYNHAPYGAVDKVIVAFY